MMEMRQALLKGFAVLLFANLIALIAGCEEANQSDVKKHRLIAAENKQLQAQLQAETQRRDKEIQKLKDQLAQSEKERQDYQLKTEKERQDCEQVVENAIKERIEGVLSAAMDEASKVNEENERLKAEIKQLKSKKSQ